MILPSYLTDLGYEEYKPIQRLQKISWKLTDEGFLPIEPWYSWRNIFEYLSCVEFARHELLALPTGRELGSNHLVPARYHSANLIFFAQAVLDNIVGWLCSYKEIDIHKSQKVFHKQLFKNKLCVEIPSFQHFFDEYEQLIKDIELYRSEWIHRMVGGAEIYSTKNPQELEAEMSIMVPIDPTVKKLTGEEYIKRIEELTDEHGTWLYSLEEFTEGFSKGTKFFVLDCLEYILNYDETMR